MNRVEYNNNLLSEVIFFFSFNLYFSMDNSKFLNITVNGCHQNTNINIYIYLLYIYV